MLCNVLIFNKNIDKNKTVAAESRVNAGMKCLKAAVLLPLGAET